MPLGMKVGLGPGDFVFDGDRATPRKRAHPYAHLLWPNGWMDQDATWYGGKRRPRRRCVKWGRSSPLKGAPPPVLGSCLLWPNGWMDDDASWYGSRPRPRPHCIRRGSSSISTKGTQQPLPLIGPCRLGRVANPRSVAIIKTGRSSDLQRAHGVSEIICLVPDM